MADPATDGQNAPIVPGPQAPGAQPAQDTTVPVIPSNGPVVPPTTPLASSTVLPQPKPTPESFTEGGTREINPSYTTDANGQTIRSEPARTVTKKSILGSILFGALEGATRGVAAQTPQGATGTGAAFSAGARAAADARLAKDNRAREIAQQDFLNKQKATKERVENNLTLAETAHISQVMSHDEKMEPGILYAQKIGNESAELSLRGGQTAMNINDHEHLDNLIKGGMDPKVAQMFIAHSPQMTALAPALVAGGAKMYNNGERGQGKNGVAIIPTSVLDTIIPKGVNLTYNTYGKHDADGKLIPGSIVRDKDGVPIPTQGTVTGDGVATLGMYDAKFEAGRHDLYQDQQKTLADMTMQQHKAAMEDDASKRELEHAQAEAALLGVGAGPAAGDPTKTGGAYIATLPQMNQDLVHGLLRYQTDVNAAGRGKLKPIIAAEAIHADPNWSQAKYHERYSYLADYGGGLKTAGGAQRNRLNIALGHFDALGEAAKNLAQGVPISDWVLNHFQVQAGATPQITYQIIANKAAGEMAGAVKGGSGSATDQEIDKALKSYNMNLGPAAQAAAVKTSVQLLDTVQKEIGASFQSTMGTSPDAFGQPVVSPESQKILDKWLNPISPPKLGDVKTFPNGAKGVWDGQGWFVQGK